MIRDNFPIVLSAPSGAGKTTLAHLLIDSVNNLKISISHTTRPPRGHEEHNRDYFFVSDKEFETMIKKDEFIEWAKVHGHYYGSSKSWTNSTLKQGSDVLYDIDVQGGLQIKDKLKNALLIFILPPSMKELEHRLLERASDDKAEIKRRMKAAEKEIKVGLKSYDFVINNEKLDRALSDLTAIIRCKHIERFDRKKLLNKLLV